MKETKYFKEILKIRGIEREWVDRTILHPDQIENQSDGTRHYIYRIQEYGNRGLRVVGVEFLGISSRATEEELSNFQFQTA